MKMFASATDKSFPRPVVTPEDLVVLRNEEAALHCRFTAVPAPTLEWYHEKELLTNKSRFVLELNLPLTLTSFISPPTFLAISLSLPLSHQHLIPTSFPLLAYKLQLRGFLLNSMRWNSGTELPALCAVTPQA